MHRLTEKRSTDPRFPALTLEGAENQIVESCFTAGRPELVGAELEFLLAGSGGWSAPSAASAAALDEWPGATPLDGVVTFEPGGQLELSSRPYSTLAKLVEAVRLDLTLIEGRLRDAQRLTIPLGIDPVGAPELVAHAPRYAAMDRYFAPWEPFGKLMMCSTASVQVNLPAGPSDVEFEDRWRMLYAVGPTLAATFANSSWQGGRRTGYRSRRLATWLRLDPSRTGVPHGAGSSVAAQYAHWTLDARVMMISNLGTEWEVPERLTFREWIQQGYARGGRTRSYPTAVDLDLHLSTLFPHVRPRGYFEVRFIDAQPGAWWSVPVAVLFALCADSRAGEAAREACDRADLSWSEAAQVGLDHPGAKAAALEVLDLAADVLARERDTEPLAQQVSSYADRWTSRGRAPCDDALSPAVLVSHRIS